MLRSEIKQLREWLDTKDLKLIRRLHNTLEMMPHEFVKFIRDFEDAANVVKNYVEEHKCSSCKGSGTKMVGYPVGMGKFDEVPENCSPCEGTGMRR